MLGMFAGTPASFPLTYTYVGQAEAPQGKADVIDVKGPNNFAARLFIADNGLPLMLTWQAPGPPGGAPGGPPPGAAPGPPGGAPAGPPPGAASPGAPAAAAAKPPVEQRLFFADYKEVDGLKLPFRLRRAAGRETTEETTFDRYRINPKIAPAKFAVVK